MNKLRKQIPLILILWSVCLSGASWAGAAVADIAVVVAADSDIAMLNREDVREIFLGITKRYPNGEAVVPLDQSDAPIRDRFVEKVLGFQVGQLRSYWASQIFTGRGRPPQRVKGDQQVKELVNAIPGAIGYINAESVDETVKVVYVFKAADP